MNLTFLNSYCFKKNIPGNTHIRCVPVDYILKYPEFILHGHNFIQDIELKAGQSWIILPCVTETIDFQEKEQQTKHGPLTTPTISAFISNDTPNIAQVTNYMKSQEWIVLIQYKSGEVKVIGEPLAPARFSSSLSNGADSKSKGYSINFFSNSVEKTFFIDAELEAPVACAPATYKIKLNGVQLSNGIIASGSHKNIEISGFIPLCLPATFEINNIEVATIPSGQSGSIKVLKQVGTDEIGSLVGADWRVGNSVVTLVDTNTPTPNTLSTTNVPATESAQIVAPDGTVTVNRDGVFFADIPVLSGGTAAINVPSSCPLPTYFEMVIKTDNPGTTASNQITIPFNGNIGLFIQHGDGNTSSYVFSGTGANSVTLTYAAAGTYTLIMYGFINRIVFASAGDRLKVLSINNWGVTPYSSLLSAFNGCQNMVINAVDTPNLVASTTLQEALRNTAISAGNINSWNVATITNMQNLFRECVNFNTLLSGWVLNSALTTINGIFRDSGMNAANYTDTLVAWGLQSGAPNNVNATSQNGMTFDSSRPAPAPYFTAGAVRTFLTTAVISGGKGWTISGDTVI
jgi:hypothetical protein